MLIYLSTPWINAPCYLPPLLTVRGAGWGNKALIVMFCAHAFTSSLDFYLNPSAVMHHATLPIPRRRDIYHPSDLLPTVRSRAWTFNYPLKPTSYWLFNLAIKQTAAEFILCCLKVGRWPLSNKRTQTNNTHIYRSYTHTILWMVCG